MYKLRLQVQKRLSFKLLVVTVHQTFVRTTHCKTQLLWATSSDAQPWEIPLKTTIILKNFALVLIEFLSILCLSMSAKRCKVIGQPETIGGKAVLEQKTNAYCTDRVWWNKNKDFLISTKPINASLEGLWTTVPTRGYLHLTSVPHRRHDFRYPCSGSNIVSVVDCHPWGEKGTQSEVLICASSKRPP